jgi:hypothetical protein
MLLVKVTVLDSLMSLRLLPYEPKDPCPVLCVVILYSYILFVVSSIPAVY